MSDHSAGEATPRPWTMSISDLQRTYRLSYAQAGDLHHDLAHNDERDALIAALKETLDAYVEQLNEHGLGIADTDRSVLKARAALSLSAGRSLASAQDGSAKEVK